MEDDSGRVSRWAEAEMLAAFRAAEDAADLERCRWCGAADREDGNEMLLCSGEGCQRSDHLQFAGLTAMPEGDWLCPASSYGVEKEMLEEGDDDGAQLPLAEAVEQPAVAQQIQAAGKLVWWNAGQRAVIDGQWFSLKRWLGAHNVAEVYSRLSRQQAIALLDGFCQADSDWKRVRYDDSGEPTGEWSCSHSSFPLIDQLMLIGQLAGAAVDLRLHTTAGKVHAVTGRRLSVDHWALLFTFTRPDRLPMQTAPLAQPVDVSDDMEGRGYYQYADDGQVYDITVEGNSNFLTQRLSMTRLGSGGVCVRAQSVFVGNCLAFHLHHALTLSTVIPYPSYHHLLMSYVAQLEAAGQWHWAVYLVMQAARVSRRHRVHVDEKAVCGEIIARHLASAGGDETAAGLRVDDTAAAVVMLRAGDEEDEQQQQRPGDAQQWLLQRVGVPAEWFARAQAASAMSHRRHEAACSQLEAAEEYSAAHRVFVAHLAAAYIVTGDMARLTRGLHALQSHARDIAGWAEGGGLLMHWLRLRHVIEQGRSEQAEEEREELRDLLVELRRTKQQRAAALVERKRANGIEDAADEAEDLLDRAALQAVIDDCERLERMHVPSNGGSAGPSQQQQQQQQRVVDEHEMAMG